MRTTLTLEDDLAATLKERARATGRSFKAVVNEVIRRGLSAGEEPLPGLEPFSVQPHACGFRPGVDTGKLNQLVDELELESFGDLTVREEDPDAASSSGDG